MDDNKRAYVSMAEKVDLDIKQYETELTASPAADVVGIGADIHAKIDEILNNDSKANQVNTGQTTQKNNERSEVILSARQVVPFLYKFFKQANQLREADRINFTSSYWDGIDDNKVYEDSKLVYDTAHVSATLTGIIALGYTNPLHTAHATNNGEFRDLIASPRQLVGDNSSFKRATDRGIDELRVLLDSADVEMNLVEFTLTQIFESYYACRGIDNAASGVGSISTGVVAGGETKIVRAIVYDASINLKIENLGDENLLFLLMLGGVQVGNVITVAGHDTQNHSIADLHTDGDKLMVRNPSVNSGSYRVTFS